MIARNYRRFPEALLYQLELALGDVANTIEGIRVRGGAAWANLVRRYQDAAEDVRGVVPVPGWLREMRKRARTLAVDVKNRCLDLANEKHQVDPRTPAAKNIADLDFITADLWNRLNRAGIHTLDDLADLTPDELTKITGRPAEEATAMLHAARAHWWES